MGLFKEADVVVILKVHIMLWDYNANPLVPRRASKLVVRYGSGRAICCSYNLATPFFVAEIDKEVTAIAVSRYELLNVSVC